jgi:alpha-1,3-mannosyltransferase
VFDARGFLPPHNIRFRIAQNDFDENGIAKTVTEKASECFLPSVDMWKAGMGKIVIIPKARYVSNAFYMSTDWKELIGPSTLFLFSLAYSLEDYEFYRKDGPQQGSRTLSEETVKWVLEPPPQVAFQDRAVWYEPEVRIESMRHYQS